MSKPRAAQLLLLLFILLAGSLTMILQKWVGNITLYQAELEERRLVLHEAILNNQLPPGYTSWKSLGANGINIRVATVYLAEKIHRITNISILKIYKLIDTGALFISMLLLVAYLRKTSPPIYTLIGLLYFAAILPLTYFFAVFHPWDRLSLVCWIALLILLRSERHIAFTALLAISITVKYDTLLLPSLYFLANVAKYNWPRVVVSSALMFTVSFGVWIGLRIILPGGFEDKNVAGQLLINLSDFRSNLFYYPPLLSFIAPILLALIGFRYSDRFSRASVIFGILLFVPFIILANFIEIRTQIPILILLLPSSLIGLKTL
ncbi:MAG: hypothetical protein IPL59_12425 [Candidatus Competibacteraceae bacterium]|nr:hypothetical protein [Candidatus Competibacteraceae bacterium]